MFKRFFSLLIVFVMGFSLAQAEFVITDHQQETTFFSDTPVESSSDASASSDSSSSESWPKTIVISVGGDCTLGCTDSQRSRSTGFYSVIQEKGYAWPFSQLLSVFGEDDLTLVNFEGTLTDSNDKVEKKFNFKGPAEYTQMLTLGSVEAVNLANNHYGDYGSEGKEDTRAALDEAGIVYCASGMNGIYETKGVKIGLIGNTFPYQNSRRDISEDVKELRDAGCQIILASFHWGSEYEKAFSGDQRKIGRAAIESGADAVIGHHPHIIQGIEAYEGSYILYSLGNLVFGGNTDPDDRDTFVAQLTFTVYEDGTVEGPQLKLIPVRLTELSDNTDYRPILAQGDQAERILEKILSRSSNMKDFVNPD